LKIQKRAGLAYINQGENNMEIPHALREVLEQQLTGSHHKQILSDAQTISMRYRTQKGKGERLLTSDTEALAYAAARMPATFGAVSTALSHALAVSGCKPQTLLDVGAGTGAASWAAESMLPLKSIACLEREDAMIKTGELLMRQGPQALRKARWIRFDLSLENIPERADMVIASYVLNEMTDAGRARALQKLWDAAEMMLLIVEPGTPAGFSHIMEARQALLQRGAHIAAPCPHEAVCQKASADWCYFTCRVSRSRLHRQLKGGEAPYEDEKFSYIALTREKCCCYGARILRHPQVHSGHVTLEICTPDGVRNVKLSKRDGDVYKRARKAKTGDMIGLDGEKP